MAQSAKKAANNIGSNNNGPASNDAAKPKLNIWQRLGRSTVRFSVRLWWIVGFVTVGSAAVGALSTTFNDSPENERLPNRPDAVATVDAFRDNLVVATAPYNIQFMDVDRDSLVSRTLKVGYVMPGAILSPWGDGTLNTADLSPLWLPFDMLTAPMMATQDGYALPGGYACVATGASDRLTPTTFHDMAWGGLAPLVPNDGAAQLVPFRNFVLAHEAIHCMDFMTLPAATDRGGNYETAIGERTADAGAALYMIQQAKSPAELQQVRDMFAKVYEWRLMRSDLSHDTAAVSADILRNFDSYRTQVQGKSLEQITAMARTIALNNTVSDAEYQIYEAGLPFVVDATFRAPRSEQTRDYLRYVLHESPALRERAAELVRVYERGLKGNYRSPLHDYLAPSATPVEPVLQPFRLNVPELRPMHLDAGNTKTARLKFG